MTIFDCLKEIITHKKGNLTEDPEFKRSFNVFMICRYLSMDKRFANAAAHANSVQCVLTQEQMYRMLLSTVPRQQNAYIKYISKPKKKKVKDDQE